MTADTPSIGLAFAAGMVSFLSPCCLPLVPGYLATVSGSESLDGGQRLDRRMLGRSLVFVSTFSLIFILFGLASTAAGEFLFDNQATLNRVAGVAIVGMGLLFVVSLAVPRLNRDWRPDGLLERAQRGSPVVVGAAFAIAWTPCVGPALGAILGLAATSSGTPQGGLLLGVYSAGLALSFLATAMSFDSATRAFGFFKRHYALIQAVSGVVLIAMGILVLTDEMYRLNIEVQQFLDRYDLNIFQSV